MSENWKLLILVLFLAVVLVPMEIAVFDGSGVLDQDLNDVILQDNTVGVYGIDMNGEDLKNFFSGECDSGFVTQIYSDGSYRCESNMVDGGIGDQSLADVLGVNNSAGGKNIDGLGRVTAEDVDVTGDNIVIVDESSDLPTPEAGYHKLEDNTVYYFKGFVSSPYGLELGSATPLIGSHGSTDGFIHVGGGTAIKGRNAGFFIRNLYVHAPGGTIFDLQADNSTEFLAESCAFSDAGNIGDIADLGVIDGYRVPTFKGCNFEDFDSGLTFKGSPAKILIGQSPFRKVDEPGVDIITFDSSLEVSVVDVAGNYFKGVRSDTTVFNAESGSLPSENFIYRGNLHDESVNESLILTGDIGANKVGTKVSDSYPLADSETRGIFSGEGSRTISGSGSGFQRIDLETSAVQSERVSMNSNSSFQYDSRFGNIVDIVAVVTITGVGSEDVEISGALNGDRSGRVTARGSTFNSNAFTTITIQDEVLMEEGDEFSLYIRNNAGNGDVTVTDVDIIV